MTLFIYNILISMLWALLTGNISAESLTLGFVLGYFALTLLYPDADQKSSYFQKTIQFVSFVLYFIKELVVSSYRIAIDVLKHRPLMRPGIVGIPLDARTDFEITMLANLITLTPGTLSLDVSEDRQTLYIHAMYVINPDDLREEIKSGLERRLLELLR